MGQYLKNKKNRNLVVWKPENHLLTLKPKKNKIQRREQDEGTFFLDGTKLQFDQIKRKIVAKFNKPLWI